jgi:hypothetical protein
MNQEFVDAIKHRFSVINVKKMQSLVKRGKVHKEVLDIHNKIKIITSNDSTFAVWSEVIASHNQSELLDPETNPPKKFKDNKTWRSEKKRVFLTANSLSGSETSPKQIIGNSVNTFSINQKKVMCMLIRR